MDEYHEVDLKYDGLHVITTRFVRKECKYFLHENEINYLLLGT